MQFSPSLTSVSDERTIRLRILGVDGANPTKELGQGCSVVRTGEGVCYIQFPTGPNHPGTFIGWSKDFGAATPADLKGYTAVRDTYDTTNRRLPFTVFNASDTAADLIADQYIDIAVTFSTNSEAA